MLLRIPVCTACGLLAPCGKCAVNGFDTTPIDVQVDIVDEPDPKPTDAPDG